MYVIWCGGLYRRKSGWNRGEGGLMTLIHGHMNGIHIYHMNLYIYHVNATRSGWNRGIGRLWTHSLIYEWYTCIFHMDLYIIWMSCIHMSRDNDSMYINVIWIYISSEWVAVISIYILSRDNDSMYIYIIWTYISYEWIAVISIYISYEYVHHMNASHSYVEGQWLSHKRHDAFIWNAITRDMTRFYVTRHDLFVDTFYLGRLWICEKEKQKEPHYQFSIGFFFSKTLLSEGGE